MTADRGFDSSRFRAALPKRGIAACVASTRSRTLPLNETVVKRLGGPGAAMALRGITDAIGRAVAFILAPGQAHELPHAIALLDQLPDVPGWVVADRGSSRHAFREHIWSLGARPAIPRHKTGGPVAQRVPNDAAILPCCHRPCDLTAEPPEGPGRSCDTGGSA